MKVKKRHCMIRSRGGSRMKTAAFINSTRCFFCSCEMTDKKNTPLTKTKEHIIPRALGGKNAAPNVVAACYKCNSERADLLTEFLANRFEPIGLNFVKKSFALVVFRLWKIWQVTSWREYWQIRGIPDAYLLTLNDELYLPLKEFSHDDA